jgi:hypothetical protein
MLEDGSRRLKSMVADVIPDKQMLQKALKGSRCSPQAAFAESMAEWSASMWADEGS